MARPQPGVHVLPVPRWRWMVAVLIVLGVCSLAPRVWAHRGFTERDIQGTWAFAATGTVVPPPSDPAASDPAVPFVLVGLITFADDHDCTMTLTINAGGKSWSSSSLKQDGCTFRVRPQGTGTLKATFTPGEVPFPSLKLFFVIVNADEILAIRTDSIVASGVLRRQIP